MKSTIIALVSLFSTASFACPDPLTALQEYYGAGGEQVKVRHITKNIYSVKTFDPYERVSCKGGRAKVELNCEVVPVRALYCVNK